MKAALRVVPMVLLGAGWFWLTHDGLTRTEPGLIHIFNALLWPLLGVLIATWAGPWRALGLVAIFATLAVVYSQATFLTQHVGWLYFVQDQGFGLFLAFFFARTLGSKEGALCSRIAGIVLGRMTPQLADYGWRLTAVWTGFFLVSALISAGLFFAAPISYWSWFVNVCYLPLIGLLFAVEAVVRRWVLPAELQGNLRDTIRVFAALKKSGGAPAGGPRP